ncbi:unnamed protein product, partial [Gadus morhua 'NCC']
MDMSITEPGPRTREPHGTPPTPPSDPPADPTRVRSPHTTGSASHPSANQEGPGQHWVTEPPSTECTRCTVSTAWSVLLPHPAPPATAPRTGKAPGVLKSVSKTPLLLSWMSLPDLLGPEAEAGEEAEEVESGGVEEVRMGAPTLGERERIVRHGEPGGAGGGGAGTGEDRRGAGGTKEGGREKREVAGRTKRTRTNRRREQRGARKMRRRESRDRGNVKVEKRESRGEIDVGTQGDVWTPESGDGRLLPCALVPPPPWTPCWRWVWSCSRCSSRDVLTAPRLPGERPWPPCLSLGQRPRQERSQRRKRRGGGGGGGGSLLWSVSNRGPLELLK